LLQRTSTLPTSTGIKPTTGIEPTTGNSPKTRTRILCTSRPTHPIPSLAARPLEKRRGIAGRRRWTLKGLWWGERMILGRVRRLSTNPARRRGGFCPWLLKRGDSVSSHSSSQREGIPETLSRTPRCPWAPTFHHSQFSLSSSDLVLHVPEYSIFIRFYSLRPDLDDSARVQW
jgi:hypothetical protein